MKGSYRLPNPSDLVHMDIDVELTKAKRMADHMDRVLDLLSPSKPLPTTDTCCQECGRRLTLSGAEDPLKPWICWDCCTADTRDYRPDTGFGS